jgi:LuxR family maltose regulon positive regulatory protein
MATPTQKNYSYPLVGTKLNKPRGTSDLVLRPRLIEKLNRGLDRKLTLLSASAGYGKTTLLLSWLERCERSSVWLSLDEYDNELTRFINYAIAAIRACHPSVGEAALALLNEEKIPPLDHIVASLVNELSELDEPFIFAIDDFHRIHDADVLQFMRELIRAQPEQVHFAIASRSDPTLMLPGLRANHQLAEIRTRDLRFSDSEAAQFFHGAVGDSVDQATAIGLNQLAEGWTVGLRLAALSLQTGRDGAAILHGYKEGSSDFVTDYLMGEVLHQQPEPVQKFLLETSILDRFCAELCEAVSSTSAEIDPADTNADTNDVADKVAQSDHSAVELLVHVRRTNLFLVSLDAEQGWYRYHHLFSELLQQRLLSLHGRQYAEDLHRRASNWFAEHGYLEEAIQYALSANDTELAVYLIESQNRNLLNPIGRAVLERWLSLLPEEVFSRRPQILIARAWLLFRQWNISALEAALDRIQDLLDEGAYTSDERRRIAGQMAALRCVTACIVYRDWQSTIDLSDEVFDQSPGSAHDARSVALMMRTVSQQATGERALAIHQLVQNIENYSSPGAGKTQSYISLALLHYMAGDLTQMHRTIDHMLSFSVQSVSVNATAGANYVAGFLYYEWNDLPTAETHFTQMLEIRHRSNYMGGLAAGLGLIRIYRLKDQLGKAQELTDILRSELLGYENYYLLPMLEAAQAQQNLLQGDRLKALGWARSTQPHLLRDCVFSSDPPVLTQTRILVQCGKEVEIRAQQAMLNAQLADAEASFFTNKAIQALAHLALVSERLNQPDEALSLLHRCFLLAQGTGFIRSVIDAGIDLTPYLPKLRALGVESDYIDRLLTAIDDSRSATSSAEQHPSAEVSPNCDLVEPLTRREDEILQLLGRGMTNQEIADELVLSPHTVKTHATHISAKLGVRGRSRAVHKARQLGILLDRS